MVNAVTTANGSRGDGEDKQIEAEAGPKIGIETAGP
jgi:hypothetical protein